MEWLKYAAKAVIAGVTTGGALLTTALLDGKIDGGEWITVVVGTAVAVATVFSVGNGDKPV